MPIGGNAQVTINVGAKLQVLQSSVNEIQKVLDKLEPKSSGFKTLSGIVETIKKDMDRLQIQASKPFGSPQQFKQTEKTIARIEESFDKAELAMSRLDFKDIKLTEQQKQSFEDLKNELTDIEKAFAAAKETIKQGFLKDKDNVDFLKNIDANLVDKKLDDIIKRVDRKVAELNNKLYRSEQKLSTAQANRSFSGSVEDILNGNLTKDSLGGEIFGKFFQTTKRGAIRFNTTDFGKGEVKKQFLEALASALNIDAKEFEPYVEMTYAEMQKAFAKMGQSDDNLLSEALKKQKEELEKIAEAQAEVDKNRQEYDVAAGKQRQLHAIYEEGGEGAKVTKEYNDALEERTKREKKLKDETTQNIQKDKEYANANREAAGATNQLVEELNRANIEFLKQQRQLQTFNSIKSAIVNFMGFNQVLNITRNVVRNAINHIKELDTTMNGIAIVTDMTTADLWKQVDAYSSMAQSFGVTIQGAYEVSKIYYQAGYETNEVLTLTNETLKLAKISGLDYATTTDYMMTAMRGFKLEMEDASRVVDVYSNLAANTAVSQQELAEAMTRTASSMESVGATFEQTSAMIATMVAVTRESANNIGSAMKSIASRYGELTKDPAALLDSEGEAMSFNKVDTALKSVGITLQTTDHQFRNFTEVIMELAEKWDTLDSAQQRY